MVDIEMVTGDTASTIKKTVYSFSEEDFLSIKKEMTTKHWWTEDNFIRVRMTGRIDPYPGMLNGYAPRKKEWRAG